MAQTNGKKIFLFALSTCIWCRRLKALLDGMNIQYDYVFVDQTEGAEKEKIVAEMKRYNPSLSFPTLIIDGQAVVGFQEEKIKEMLSQ
ncbi:MAG: glutaredoxin family protein [Elusimicrobiaceae bacterium]|jgi:glutaredoxin